MKTYIKANARELAEMVTTAPFGSVIAFGYPAGGDYSVDTLDELVVEDWNGCYCESGRLDNRYFIMDQYGGGRGMIETLEDTSDPARFTDLDKEYIEACITTYLQDWELGDVVYAAVEKEPTNEDVFIGKIVEMPDDLLPVFINECIEKGIRFDQYEIPVPKCSGCDNEIETEGCWNHILRWLKEKAVNY